MTTFNTKAIYLLGLRASGKSTVGRLLAARLGCAFVDLDDVTPGVLGERKAADALRGHGEAAFRAAERKALDEPSVLTAGVVALGGGTATHGPSEAELRRRVAGGARVVYLRAKPETMQSRLESTDLAGRPSLTGQGTLGEVGTLWARRDPLYRSLATRVIEVDQMSPEAVADAVAAEARG